MTYRTMPYRTMPELAAPVPPRKWPQRLGLGFATFVGALCSFMLATHADGSTGYRSGVLCALMVGALGGAVASVLLGVVWPWARSVGWPAGALFAFGLVALHPDRRP